jgi:hypothetical protein
MPTSECGFGLACRSFFRRRFVESLLELRPLDRPSRVRAGTDRELMNEPRLLGEKEKHFF